MRILGVESRRRVRSGALHRQPVKRLFRALNKRDLGLLTLLLTAAKQAGISRCELLAEETIEESALSKWEKDDANSSAKTRRELRKLVEGLPEPASKGLAKPDWRQVKEYGRARLSVAAERDSDTDTSVSAAPVGSDDGHQGMTLLERMSLARIRELAREAGYTLDAR